VDLGKHLSEDNQFNDKFDNFLGLSQISNLVICSLQDEETLGQVETVGTLQLFNRVKSEVTQADLHRVSLVRKLLGSGLVKCLYYSETLQKLIALSLDGLA